MPFLGNPHNFQIVDVVNDSDWHCGRLSSALSAQRKPLSFAQVPQRDLPPICFVSSRLVSSLLVCHLDEEEEEVEMSRVMRLFVLPPGFAATAGTCVLDAMSGSGSDAADAGGVGAAAAAAAATAAAATAAAAVVAAVAVVPCFL